MNAIEIRAGLRKLEFEPATEAENVAHYAAVEFVRPAPLRPGEKVCVPLGSQGSVLRELIGEPQLLETTKLGQDRCEYRYRVRGPIAAMRAEQRMVGSVPGTRAVDSAAHRSCRAVRPAREEPLVDEKTKVFTFRGPRWGSSHSCAGT